MSTGVGRGGGWGGALNDYFTSLLFSVSFDNEDVNDKLVCMAFLQSNLMKSFFVCSVCSQLCFI